MGVCFQFRHTLLDLVKSLERFLLIRLEILVHHLKLRGNVFDCAGQSYHRITSFIIAFGKTHGAHRGNANRSTGNGCKYFDHDWVPC